MPYDIDLWVKAPRQAPVGFWNMGGETFNLLRDDLGSEADATDENYEISYSRGIPAGEYIVNVHQYGPLPADTVVKVSVVVSVRTRLEAARQILNTDVELSRQGQEVTAFRFRLDEEGGLVPDSVNTLSTVAWSRSHNRYGYLIFHVFGRRCNRRRPCRHRCLGPTSRPHPDYRKCWRGALFAGDLLPIHRAFVEAEACCF